MMESQRHQLLIDPLEPVLKQWARCWNALSTPWMLSLREHGALAKRSYAMSLWMLAGAVTATDSHGGQEARRRAPVYPSSCRSQYQASARHPACASAHGCNAEYARAETLLRRAGSSVPLGG